MVNSLRPGILNGMNQMLAVPSDSACLEEEDDIGYWTQWDIQVLTEIFIFFLS